MELNLAKKLQSHLLDQNDIGLKLTESFILGLENIHQTRLKYEVFHIIEDIAEVRPTKVNEYAELCARLADKLEFFGDIVKEQLEVHVFRNPLLYHIAIQHPHFYRALYEINFVTKDEIINLFDFKIDKSFYMLEIATLFNDIAEISNPFSSIKSIAQEIENDREFVEIIKNDDINEFQTIATGFDFDFDAKIHVFRLHKEFPLNSTQISLINLAAYFSAIKIFKFIYINNFVSLEGTASYAIAGGCYEIIRILNTQEKIEFANQIKFAICFYHDDICQWIQDQYNVIPEFKIISTNNPAGAEYINDINNLIYSGNITTFNVFCDSGSKERYDEIVFDTSLLVGDFNDINMKKNRKDIHEKVVMCKAIDIYCHILRCCNKVIFNPFIEGICLPDFVIKVENPPPFIDKNRNECWKICFSGCVFYSENVNELKINIEFSCKYDPNSRVTLLKLNKHARKVFIFPKIGYYHGNRLLDPEMKYKFYGIKGGSIIKFRVDETAVRILA